jgi:hydrogenase expression/formation protein HypD
MSGPWTLMEVCGGQTHALLRWGLDQLLPPDLRLIHGPGCPVCVTPAERIDRALALAMQPGVIVCSYGDMLRVPGSRPGVDLLALRSRGADVRVLTTPLQALDLARRHPDRQVVMLAVGFETTAPATALLARQTLALGLDNLALLVCHVRVVPAMRLIAADAATAVQGFLAAGHVAAVMGTAELQQLVDDHRLPVVVAGFGPRDLLQALAACRRQLQRGEARLDNAYASVVQTAGNPLAQALLATVFETADVTWRGLGLLTGGGLRLRGRYARLDADRRFGPLPPAVDGPGGAEHDDGPCISGRILRGLARPVDCPAFGGACTPEHPLGAPMVSSEGACAAHLRYRRR